MVLGNLEVTCIQKRFRVRFFIFTFANGTNGIDNIASMDHTFHFYSN